MWRRGIRGLRNVPGTKFPGGGCLKIVLKGNGPHSRKQYSIIGYRKHDLE